MNIEQFLGQITVNANEDNAYGGNFSNIYEVGTKLYQIFDISPNEAIAIEIEEGKYIKAMFQE
ncbi:hypothetical protein AB990_15655 [Alkalihalobacillus pseudalcaliphilus]|nr:hypothetical protein AB990_15655 [Alkalihalobacillus pseudalcaliphilus]